MKTEEEIINECCRPYGGFVKVINTCGGTLVSQIWKKAMNEYANLVTEQKERRIKSLESLCAIAGVPDSVVAVFSKAEITDEDRQWAKEKINNLPPTTFTRT